MDAVKTIIIKLARTKNETNDVKLPTTKLKSTLHNSIAFVLTLAQCFGLMPVAGITSSDVCKIKFQWCSFRTFYVFANLCGAATLLIMNFIKYINTGMQFGDIVSVVFFTSIVLTILLFLRIATKWHDFSMKRQTVEKIMNKYEYQPNLSRRFKITTSIIMFLAIGEHILFISQIVVLLHNCPLSKSAPIKSYYGAAFSQIFALTSFTYWKAYLVQFINILSTFAWNFMDLFVMLMCASMAEGFRQINKRVANAKVLDEEFWKEIREDYNRLANLCRSLDSTINHLITLCLANDLFFICVQLFRTLKPLNGIVHLVYFMCSFGFLVGRTAAVSLHAAWINDESKIMLDTLFNVPSVYFGTEANRLIQQISLWPIAITGSNLFEVTRDFCLKVAGAIITFEVILQQVGPLLLNTPSNQGEELFCLE